MGIHAMYRVLMSNQIDRMNHLLGFRISSVRLSPHPFVLHYVLNSQSTARPQRHLKREGPTDVDLEARASSSSFASTSPGSWIQKVPASSTEVKEKKRSKHLSDPLGTHNHSSLSNLPSESVNFQLPRTKDGVSSAENPSRP